MSSQLQLLRVCMCKGLPCLKTVSQQSSTVSYSCNLATSSFCNDPQTLREEDMVLWSDMVAGSSEERYKCVTTEQSSPAA